MIEELGGYFVSAAVVGGFLVWAIQLSIKTKVDALQKDKAAKEVAEKVAADKARALEIENLRIRDELDSAVYNMLSEIHRGIRKLDSEHHYFNGEFQDAFQSVQKAMHHKREHEVTIVTEYHTDY